MALTCRGHGPSHTGTGRSGTRCGNTLTTSVSRASVPTMAVQGTTTGLRQMDEQMRAWPRDPATSGQARGEGRAPRT